MPHKNAEKIVTLVDVERLVMQEFIGTAPWDHRLVTEVLIEQVVDRLGEPDGIIALNAARNILARGLACLGASAP